MAVDVSVVVVTKNEAPHIIRCIESVLDALSSVASFEVILVDSSSTDNTVEMACKYPIRIVQLRPHWIHSPAAGMHIGYVNSKGRYVCFIGGDMELDRDWFRIAIPYLSNANVAGIAGRMRNRFEGDPKYSLVERRISKAFELIPVGEVEILGGPAMFKRSVLQEVGGYHPFLKAGEEAELSARIRTNGYKLLRLDCPMITHTSRSMSLLTYLKKYHWEYPRYVASGIRYSIRKGKVPISRNLRNIMTYAFFDISLVYMIASAVYAVAQRDLHPLIIGGAGYAIFLAVVLSIRQHFLDSVLSVLVVHIGSIAALVGFCRIIPDPDTYPTDVLVLKE